MNVRLNLLKKRDEKTSEQMYIINVSMCITEMDHLW